MPGQEAIEIERVLNLVRGFGWDLQKQEFTPDKIIITLERARPKRPEETGAGPD